MKYYVLLLGIATSSLLAMDPRKSREERQIILESEKAKLYRLMIEELTERKRERARRTDVLSKVNQPMDEVQLYKLPHPKL